MRPEAGNWALHRVNRSPRAHAPLFPFFSAVSVGDLPTATGSWELPVTSEDAISYSEQYDQLFAKPIDIKKVSKGTRTPDFFAKSLAQTRPLPPASSAPARRPSS